MNNLIKTNKGFTLAEVLITLALIGVVASATIPSLMNSTSDKELRTKWKKAYANISNATKLLILENNGTMKDSFNADPGGSGNCAANQEKVIEMYSSVMQVARTCDNSNVDGNCWYDVDAKIKRYDGYDDVSTWNSSHGFVLNDGTFISPFNHSGKMSPACTASSEGTKDDTICITFFVDVNGNKAPNQVGRDIYQMFVHENRTEPYKTTTDDSYSKCHEDYKGWGCAARWLYSNEDESKYYNGIDD